MLSDEDQWNDVPVVLSNAPVMPLTLPALPVVPIAALLTYKTVSSPKPGKYQSE